MRPPPPRRGFLAIWRRWGICCSAPSQQLPLICSILAGISAAPLVAISASLWGEEQDGGSDQFRFKSVVPQLIYRMWYYYIL